MTPTRIEYNVRKARNDAVLQFLFLGMCLLLVIFGMAAAYETAHRYEPLPHVTHGGQVHTLYGRR